MAPVGEFRTYLPCLVVLCVPSRMASTQASEKPMSEKQRLKLGKFANKKEKQAQQAQQQQPNGVSKGKKFKKQDVPAVESKDWVEETPAGQKKS